MKIKKYCVYIYGSKGNNVVVLGYFDCPKQANLIAVTRKGWVEEEEFTQDEWNVMSCFFK